MGKAYERWEKWTKADGRLAYFEWCDATDRVEVLQARRPRQAHEEIEVAALLDALKTSLVSFDELTEDLVWPPGGASSEP